MISNVSIIFLVQVVVNPIFYLINPFQILKQIRRNLIRKKFEKNKTETELNYSQKELNKIFENIDIELPEKYAYIGKLTLMAIFYLPIFPLGPVLVLISTFLLYWIEKYNIKTTYRIPPKINQIITIGHLISFKLFIFVYAISIYIFIKDLKSTYFNFSLVSLIIFSVLVIIPFGQFLNIKLIDFKIQTTYEEEYLSFLETYQNQNPLTKKSGYLNVLTRMKKQNLIDEEEYLELKKKILKGENIDIMDIKQDKLNNFNGVSPDRLMQYFFNSFMNNRNANTGFELFFQEREDHFKSDKAKDRLNYYIKNKHNNVFTNLVNKAVKNIELKQVKEFEADAGFGTNNDLLLIDGNK